MKTTKVLLFLLFSLAHAIGVKADGTWRHIEGLPCEETSCITQDSNGFLWFGTRLGLIRYDGYRHKIYRNDMRHPRAFGSCDIKCLAADGEGRIFAGAFYGLNTFSTETQRNEITHFENDDYVNAVYNDSNGRLWVGTYNGVYVKDGDNAFLRIAGFPKDLVLEFCESHESQIYVVTQNKGIWVVEGLGDCHSIPHTQDIRPRALRIDRNDVLWVGTDRLGLFSIDNGSVRRHEFFESYAMNDLLIDEEGEKLYIATDKGVISVYMKAIESRVVIWGLKGKDVERLYADRARNIWASTGADGIFFLYSGHQELNVERRAFTERTTPIISQFDVRHLNDSLLWGTIENINTIHEAADGTTYIGTWNDGLYVSRKGKISRHITKGNSPWLKNNGIYSIASLTDSRILFATWVGLYLMPPDGLSGHAVEHIGRSTIGELHTLTMTRMGENEVWLGLVGGIAHIKMKDEDFLHSLVTIYTHVNQAGIQQPDNLGAIANAQDEGTDYRLGGIYRILQDKHGRIWACTSEPGLLLYNRERDVFECVSDELGILGDNVHSFDIDEYGDFWMATNYGILRMGIDAQGQVEHRHLYTEQDGLPSSYFGSTMSSALADGSICFVNHERFITLKPSKEPDNRNKGRVQIADFMVNGDPPTSSNGEMAIWPAQRESIVLNHDENNISISFSALSYGEETSIRYAYKLSGIDHEYLETEMGSNSITYSQIPPGKYTLYYGLAGETHDDDEWSEALTITILQPLWWRWWAKLIYVILIATVAYTVIHSLVDRNRKHHQLELLAVEKHSLDEQYRKMTQFYVKVIHTFLTPVTLMTEQIRELQKKVRPSLQASLMILSVQTQQLQDSMNEIIKVKDDDSIREAMQKAQELTQTDRDFLRRCTESVNQHLADADYTHQVLMNDVGASHATLYRKLKQLTGMDATSFIRSIRMKAACQILKQEPNIRINELADRVGYSNPKYFSTCFKTEFGMSPREYQNSLQ